jgi:hypothetical protein
VEALEQLVDARGAAERDVRPHREVGEERVLLEDEPDGALLGGEVDARGGVVPGAVAEGDAAAVGLAQPRDRPQDRRLAGARGPDERDGLGADAQADVELEGPKRADDVEGESFHDRMSL